MCALSYEECNERAKNSDLASYEIVGFEAKHRKGLEGNVFKDILSKIPNLQTSKSSVLDVGCGCCQCVHDLIEFCITNNHRLTLVDAPEMLNRIPESEHVEKAPHEFPKSKPFLEKNRARFDAIICYSLIHSIENPIVFIDKMVSLLNHGGHLLIGDIPNIQKKNRFLSSDFGKNFHKEWSGGEEANTKFNVEYEGLDDHFIGNILFRYRSMGFETYLLPQPKGLPMNYTREDVLICKY